MFQSTRPRGARLYKLLTLATKRARFNPRARGGRDGIAREQMAFQESFNPRARGGRDYLSFGRDPGPQGFQSTRPRGARRRPRQWGYRSSLFQSTRPRGARPSSLKPVGYGTGFNPRARGGRDSLPMPGRRLMVVFQSTRPRGARLTGLPYPQLVNRFQSTRPRGARRRYDFPYTCRFQVSIHAPAGGATRLRSRSLQLAEFQSTRPRGARLSVVWNGELPAWVSIHAPAGGATQPRHGVSLFQSTRPRGARLVETLQGFNPRARAGRDPHTTLRVQFQSTRPRGATTEAEHTVSIHAPAGRDAQPRC